MVDVIQEIEEFLTFLIFVGLFCRFADVRSYVSPPFDSAVPSICGDKHMEPYLTSISDAQRVLGIGRTTAYRLKDAGKLERSKLAGAP